jgi:hypothetical protein
MPWDWNDIKKTYRLSSYVDKTAPSDISYVYGGFCPLSVRLIMLTFGKVNGESVFNAHEKGEEDIFRNFTNCGTGMLQKNSYLLKIGLTPDNDIEYPVNEKQFFETNI